jgi:cytidylate kinase
MVIAIDGPAGAGKSTVARALARELGFAYLDSGALYRCVALLSLRAPVAEPAVLARAAYIEFSPSATANASVGVGTDDAAVPRPRVLLDGHDVTTEIRTAEVTQAASRVAADPAVRAALLATQRALLARGDWVAEGRDIGTVVAPRAELKVFLTASEDARALRRARESGADLHATLAAQRARDERDATRAHSPLRAAADAIELDTSGMGVEEVMREISALAERVVSHSG